jgi:hypothetical protein
MAGIVPEGSTLIGGLVGELHLLFQGLVLGGAFRGTNGNKFLRLRHAKVARKAWK